MTGARGNALDSVEVYDPAAGLLVARGPAWAPPPAPCARRPLQGRLYAVGGARDDERSTWSGRLPRQGSGRPLDGWQPAPPLRQARLGHGLARSGRAPLRRRRADGGRGRRRTRRGLRPPPGALGAGGRPSRSPATTWPCWPSAGASTPWAAQARTAGRRRPSSSTPPPRTAGSPGRRCPEPLSNFGAAVLDERRIHALHHRRHFVLDPRRQAWARARPMPTSRHGLGLAPWAGGCSPSGAAARTRSATCRRSRSSIPSFDGSPPDPGIL